jgi:hypothetical protein
MLRRRAATINFWQAPTSGTNYTKTYTIYLTEAKLTSYQTTRSDLGHQQSILRRRPWRAAAKVRVTTRNFRISCAAGSNG